MANRRNDRPLPDGIGWWKYDGDYEKRYYDIVTYNGVTHSKCWPNAGHFYSESGSDIDGRMVFAIREHIS